MANTHDAGLDATGGLLRQRSGEATGLAVASIVMAFLCFRLVPPLPLIGWFVAVASVAAYRFWSSGRYRPVGRLGSRREWTQSSLAGVVAIGLAFGGLAVAAMIKADPQQATVVALWLAVISASTVPVYSGARGPVLCFALPAMLLPTGMLLMRGGAGAEVAVIMLVALGLVVFGASTLYRASGRLLTMEQDVHNLRAQVDDRRAEFEKVSQQLRLDLSKRQQAENEAREATTELSLVRSKAQALSETLSRVSPLCPITGIANRRTLEEHLDAEWRRQLRAKQPLSMLMCSIDEFPHYRETYGAQAADALLHRIAKLAAGVGRRPGDLAARYDGAVIAILLPNCDSRNAVRMADGLRKRIESQRIPHEKSNIGQTLSASIGVATLIPVKEYQPSELVQRLDKALYEARFQGGNCVVAFRTMDKLKVEHWNPKSDDMLSKQAMLHKLIIRGFKVEPVGYPPGCVLPDKTAEGESVCALYQGELKLIIEGESMVLRGGDAIYIPTGTTWGAEVMSAREVLGFEGGRTE